MKTAILLLFIFLTPALPWLNDFDTARQESIKSHKLLLLSFSGSDWCGPCIRMKKEIFESPGFVSYAQDHLILVRADFPRQKKNQLGSEQVARNEHLADTYNPEGKFPLTLLINEEGRVIRSWDGFPSGEPEQFIASLKKAENAR